MKKLILFLKILFLISCTPAGNTKVTLSGEETALPPELKGLKIYTISTGGIDYVKVGVLEGYSSINTTYPVGKTTQSFILLRKSNQPIQLIEISEILSDVNGILTARK